MSPAKAVRFDSKKQYALMHTTRFQEWALAIKQTQILRMLTIIGAIAAIGAVIVAYLAYAQAQVNLEYMAFELQNMQTRLQVIENATAGQKAEAFRVVE